MKYKTKSELVDAFQYEGPGKPLALHLIPKDIDAKKGDWVVKSNDGKFIKMKKEDFEKLYGSQKGL